MKNVTFDINCHTGGAGAKIYHRHTHFTLSFREDAFARREGIEYKLRNINPGHGNALAQVFH